MSSTLSRTKKITYSAMFAAIATVVMYFEFPLPFMPPFLKVDLSGAVSLLAAFMFGPVSAVLITMVKDIIHAFSTSTGCVGELGDFLMTSAFCVAASLVYRKHHTKKGAVLGMACGTAAMTVVSCFTNKYMLIPFFAKVMPIEAILSACASVNPLVGSIDTYVIFGVVPFNLMKGLILSMITFLLYKRLSSFIRENTVGRRVDNPTKAS
ncbi:MAG: ECF transporter S component [Angelakisella sp.]|nr:ECF transporter S component [Angelakisella sp.]